MEEKAYWVGLSLLPGIGAKRLSQILRAFGSAQKAWEAGPDCLVSVLRLSSEAARDLSYAYRKLDLRTYWERLAHEGIGVLTLEEGAYPVHLLNIYDPPAILYYRGQIEPRDEKALALVGSRKATPYGLMMAEKLAEEIAAHGYTVVSGMARGIDTAAHRGALRAGGRTLAVLGSGLDVVYPRENKKLMTEIALQGAVLSEFPLGTPPDANHFPIRNRIISGLSMGVVVVEGAERSGSLITADMALEQGRDVFAIPGLVTNPYSQGPHRLIKQGAKLVETVADILEEYEEASQLSWVGNREGKTEGPLLSEVESRLMACLSVEPISMETLAGKTGLGPQEINSILLYLELKGLVRQLPGRRFVVAAL